MKIKVLITSSVIVSGLLSSIAFSKPTEDYKDAIALFKHEKSIHYKSAWRRTLWPYPFPFVLNNAISGTYGWKKYNKANKMYKLYKSAQIVVDTNDSGIEKDGNKKYEKAFNRVHRVLDKLQTESRVAAASKNGIVERKESQRILDEKVRQMTTEDLARLLNEANKTIPLTCGKPEAGVANLNAYNLRFKIRMASFYKDNISMLEEEIALEYDKMAENSSRDDELEDLDGLEDYNQEDQPGKVDPEQDQPQDAEQGKVDPEQEQEPGKVDPAPEQEQEPGKVDPAPEQEQEPGKVDPAPEQEQGKVEPTPNPEQDDSISDSEDTDDFEARLKQVELELAKDSGKE